MAIINRINNYTAGINTNSEVFTEDNEKIIIWAGADGYENSKIQAAPFKVTEDGSVYANKGNFSGSIITNSTIIGSRIEVAEIYGNAESGSALTIYDTDGGISFRSETNTQGPDILSITSSEFKAKGNSFISLSDNRIGFNGHYLKLINDTERLSFFSNKLQKERLNSLGAIEIIESEILLTDKLDFKVEGNSKIQVTSSETTFNNRVNRFSDTVNYAGVMEYQKVTNGYNLYVD